jgi:hypothetical protein
MGPHYVAGGGRRGEGIPAGGRMGRGCGSVVEHRTGREVGHRLRYQGSGVVMGCSRGVVHCMTYAPAAMRRVQRTVIFPGWRSV